MKAKNKPKVAKIVKSHKVGNVSLLVKAKMESKFTNARENPHVRMDTELDGNYMIQTIVMKAKKRVVDVKTVR